MSWHAAVDYRKAKTKRSFALPARDYGEVNKIDNDVIVAALSDDFGQTIQSHNIAKITVKSAIKTLVEDHSSLSQLIDCPEVDVATSLFRKLCNSVRTALVTGEIDNLDSLLIVSTTLVMIVASPAGTIAMRVGDGSIVYRQSGRRYESMFFQNSVNKGPISITTPDALEHIEVASQPGIAEFICASTGGLIPYSIKESEQRPRVPFFRPLDQCAALAETDDDIHRGLRAFLRTAPFIDRLEKDCTLMLGGYRSDEHRTI